MTVRDRNDAADHGADLQAQQLARREPVDAAEDRALDGGRDVEAVEVADHDGAVLHLHEPALAQGLHELLAEEGMPRDAIVDEACELRGAAR